MFLRIFTTSSDFHVPSLCDYHYKVRKLDEKILELILEECAKFLLQDKKDRIQCYDATGFAFGDKYNLKWQRGTEVRTVKSHVRLEVILAVDEEGKRVIMTVETGGPYASEIEMLRKAIERIQTSKKVPFIADKGYDAIDIIHKLLEKGFEPAIKIKETMRMSIKHPLRQLSKEDWVEYGRKRYIIEQIFGNIKQKLGSSFSVLREDIARKASIACAILWNFYILATSLFLSLLFCSLYWIFRTTSLKLGGWMFKFISSVKGGVVSGVLVMAISMAGGAGGGVTGTVSMASC